MPLSGFKVATLIVMKEPGWWVLPREVIPSSSEDSEVRTNDQYFAVLGKLGDPFVVRNE